MIESARFCVYVHELPDGRKYVGMTMRDPKKRFLNGYGYRNNTSFYSEIQRIGWTNIKHIIAADNLTFQEAAQLEIELIREFDATNPECGFNYIGGDIHSKPKNTINPENKAFAENLINLRESANISQEVLAKRVGVSQSAIWQYEKGITRPKIAVLSSIAKVLGISADSLMRGDCIEA